MGKLIKAIVILAVLVGAIAIAVHYASRGSGDTGTTQQQQAGEPKMQVQEKYGFAPVGEDN